MYRSTVQETPLTLKSARLYCSCSHTPVGHFCCKVRYDTICLFGLKTYDDDDDDDDDDGLSLLGVTIACFTQTRDTLIHII